MKITKRQLRRIIRESILYEEKKGGMLSKLADMLGIGPEAAAKKAKAYENLRSSGLEYIDEFKDAEVGPFLKKGGGGDSRRAWSVDYKWQKELNTKKYPEDVKKSIIAQAKALYDILNAYATEAKVNKNSDDVPLDVETLRQAASMPGLYSTMEKG